MDVMGFDEMKDLLDSIPKPLPTKVVLMEHPHQPKGTVIVSAHPDDCEAIRRAFPDWLEPPQSGGDGEPK